MRPLIVIALCCLLSTRVFAQDFKRGVEVYKRQDFVVALRNWRHLAEQGHAGAQYQLGIMYEYGRGVPQNDADAVKWYTLAANQGVAAAQYKLGIMYDNSWGVTQNDAEAVKWYKKAAAQGHAYAQYDLGLMFASGTGVPQDYIRAHMWLNLAIAQGNNHMIKHRKEIAKHMTPAQITEAVRMAIDWIKTQQK